MLQNNFLTTMKRISFSIFAAATLMLASCTLVISDRDFEGGTVVIANNSDEIFVGRVWTDSKELYNGKIRAWSSKTFKVSVEKTVYAEFESANGITSNPSGYVSGGRTLILDL